jgi:hypothetical protein
MTPPDGTANLLRHVGETLRYYLFTAQGQHEWQHWLPFYFGGLVLLIAAGLLWRGLAPPRARGRPHYAAFVRVRVASKVPAKSSSSLNR